MADVCAPEQWARAAGTAGREASRRRRPAPERLARRPSSSFGKIRCRRRPRAVRRRDLRFVLRPGKQPWYRAWMSAARRHRPTVRRADRPAPATRASTASSSPSRPRASAAVLASNGSESSGAAGPPSGSSMRTSASMAGKARKKSRTPRSPSGDRWLRRWPEPAERLDRVKPHVRHPRRRAPRSGRDRFGAALRTERERRLETQVLVVVTHQPRRARR